MGIAFFDLDRTLIRLNSGTLWVRSELRLGYLSRSQAARAGFHLVRYHLGLADLNGVLREAVANLGGSRESELRARTHAFYDREVRSLYRPAGVQAVARHRLAGDLCVLLTTSSIYQAERVVEDLGLDAALCNRFEVDAGGRFTGLPVEPLCYGPGKLTLAQRFAQKRSVPLGACAFYTDSYSDRSVMEAVGRPVAVSPDPSLRLLARARRWPVQEWDARI